jgi:cellulose 1,4-beta-cellobiosidase
MRTTPFVAAALLGLISAQQIGHQKQETHLPLGLKKCTKSGGCQASQKEVTLDANWRWVHKTNGYSNCYDGNKWDTSVCPDPETCARNCALDGVPQADWRSPYGIHSDGNELQLNFVTRGQYGTNVGSRTYMLNGEEYEMFQLLGQEFTFTVDVSNLPCGINGALYFVSMDKTGN